MGYRGRILEPMLYTAKCYWPGATEAELRATLLSAETRGALYLPGDELVLCLFEGPSAGAVRQATERALLPCERVIPSVWLVAPPDQGGAQCVS